LVTSAKALAEAAGGGAGSNIKVSSTGPASTIVGVEARKTPAEPSFELETFFDTVDGGPGCANEEASTASALLMNPSLGSLVTPIPMAGLTAHLEGM
jgi:hypothetical protein